MLSNKNTMAATFARSSDGEKPSIVVHPDHKVAKINDNIYGGFTEYVRKVAEPKSL